MISPEHRVTVELEIVRELAKAARKRRFREEK
jgi:hypothetical protein